MDTIKTFYTKSNKTIDRLCSSLTPVKKVLQVLSPLSSVIYAALTYYFICSLETEYLKVFGIAFIAYAAVNSLYEMASIKKSYGTIRNYLLNAFYIAASIILAYYLYQTYLLKIFGDYSNISSATSQYINSGEAWYSKIFTIGFLASMPITILMNIYQAITKYRSKPGYKNVNIYLSTRQRRIYRRNDEYKYMDLKTGVLPSFIGIIVNFFTTNNLASYGSSAANILNAFSVYDDEKFISCFMPLVLMTLVSLVVMFSGYFKVITPYLTQSV